MTSDTPHNPITEITMSFFFIPPFEGSKERQTLEVRLKKRSLPLSRGLLQLQELKLKSKSLDLTERRSDKKKKENQAKEGKDGKEAN